MSRHRNAMRKVSICDDDYDDDIAQSYDETYGVSPGTSDMYTFNRNKECTSLSQFMESGQKIVEESEYEDPNLDEMAAAALGGGRTDGTQKSKLNEEFMFDMDNQTANSFFAQKKIDVDFVDFVSPTTQDPEVFDLNSLAEQYQNKKHSPLSNCLEQESKQPLSSSIDKLLDSFFSKNFEAATATTKTPPKNDLFNFNLNETLTNNPPEDSEFSLTDILGGPRTQSIEINKSPVAISKSALGGFSLSDLANEYLTGENTNSSVGTNIVDLIDCEFGSKLSLNSDFDLDVEMEKIDFSTESLLIKKTGFGRIKAEENKMSTSLTLKPNFSWGNEEAQQRQQPRSFNSYETTENLRKRVSKKRTNSTCAKLENFGFCLVHGEDESVLESVFVVSGESLFGEFLGGPVFGCGGSMNTTNRLFESQFEYAVQKKNLRRGIVERGVGRRRIPIEVVSRYERRVSKTKASDVESVRVRKVSGSGKCKNGSNKKVKGNKDEKKAIPIFDFSIPSPDDIVIAKQKFAFKNMRFK